MMRFIFQYLNWKNTWRSQRMGTGIATKIIMGFLILYFGAVFAVLGIFFDKIIEDSPFAEQPMLGLHTILFYYLMFDLVIRIIFQEVSEVKFRQLCLLPISRSRIIYYILRSTVLSIFQLLPLFFIIPFTIKHLIPDYGIILSLCWIIAVCSMLLLNNFLALQIKHKISGNPLFYVVPILIVGLLYLVDARSWIPISDYVNHFFIRVLEHGFTCLIPVGVAYAMFRLVFRRMQKQAYISSDFLNRPNFMEQFSFGGLDNLGYFGLIAQLNLRLIFRNKRIRTQVLFSMIFLLYGLYLYRDGVYGPAFLLFWGLYMTGVIAMALAPYIWSYQGNYVELLFSLPISMKQYIRIQYNFLILVCLVTTIPSMFYYFMQPDVPKINGAAFLFNVGVNIPVLLLASTYNKKKLDINTAGTFNMQGISGMQFLFIFLVLVVPVFVFLPFSVFNRPDWGLSLLAIVGLFGLLLQPLIIRGIETLVKEKKYSLTEHFRSNA